MLVKNLKSITSTVLSLGPVSATHFSPNPYGLLVSSLTVSLWSLVALCTLVPQYSVSLKTSTNGSSPNLMSFGGQQGHWVPRCYVGWGKPKLAFESA